MDTKEQAKNEDGSVKKAETIPHAKEIICPLIHKLTGGAVRYDVTFAPTITLGDNPPGAWRSAPQITLTEEARTALKEGIKTWKDITSSDIQVDGKGQAKARSYALQFWQTLESLREAGKIGWDDQAFYFTHEQGMEARKKYEQSVLEGAHKANKRSWTGTPDDPDKPGFADFAGVTWEQLEKGEVPDPARTMKMFQWFQQSKETNPELYELFAEQTLGTYMRELYKKSTTTYVSKASKRDKIAKVVQGMGLEMTDLPQHLEEIAEQCGMPADEVKDLILGDVEIPSKEEILEEAEESDETEPTSEDLAALEVPPEEELVAGIQTLERERIAPLGDPTFINVYPDTSKERISVSSEAVVVRGADHEDHVHHFVELPESEAEMFLEEGFVYEIRRWRVGEEPTGDVEVVGVLPNETSTQQEAD